MAHWRDEIKPEIKEHFERLVTKSAKHKDTYEKARQGAIAQLWTANAIQEKELDELHAKIAAIESRIGATSSLKLGGMDKTLMGQIAMRVAVLEKMLKCTAMQNEKKQVLCMHNGIVREKGHLYFISRDGKLAKAPMARGGEKKIYKQEILHDCNIHKEPGWLYYVDSEMNAARSRMKRETAETAIKIPKKYANDLRKAISHIKKLEKMKNKISLIEDRVKSKLPVFEKAIKALAEKGRIAEQAAMKARFLEKALAEISGKKPEEDKIDANKAMREMISRKAVKKF